MVNVKVTYRGTMWISRTVGQCGYHVPWVDVEVTYRGLVWRSRTVGRW